MPNLDSIMENREKKSNFKKREYRPWNIEGFNNSKLTNSDNFLSNENIVLLDCDNISNWEYSDRPIAELGDLDALAKDLLNIGQQQPCVVRHLKGKKDEYEIIIGERRWRAAKLANIKLKVIIKDLTDNQAALVQAAENDNRVDLSDYAKSKSFQTLIDKGIISQNELIEKLNKSKQYISTLLSYWKIPDEISISIGDYTKVTAKTAERIKQISKKGEIYIQAIKHYSKDIRNGTLGSKKLEQLIDNFVQQKNKSENEIRKVYSVEGKHILTVKQNQYIYITKYTIAALKKKNKNIESVLEKIVSLIYEDKSPLERTLETN